MYQWVSDKYGPIADWLFVNGFKLIGLPAGLMFLGAYFLLCFLLPGMMRKGSARWALIAWPICVLLIVPPYWRALGIAMASHEVGSHALDVLFWRWLDMIGLVIAATVCLPVAVYVPFFKNDGDRIVRGEAPHRSDKDEHRSVSWIQREVSQAKAEQARVTHAVVAMRNQSHSG